MLIYILVKVEFAITYLFNNNPLCKYNRLFVEPGIIYASTTIIYPSNTKVHQSHDFDWIIQLFCSCRIIAGFILFSRIKYHSILFYLFHELSLLFYPEPTKSPYDTLTLSYCTLMTPRNQLFRSRLDIKLTIYDQVNTIVGAWWG